MTKQHQYELEKEITQQSQTSEASDSQELAWKIAEAADDKKGADLVILKVNEVSYLADYFVIVTGFSKAQVRAIADAVEAKVAETFNHYPIRMAGKSEGSWILQDYGEVILHIFMPQEREYYNLEAFWGHAQRIEYIGSM